MRLDDDFDDDYDYDDKPDKHKNMYFASTLLCVSIIALFTLIIVFAANRDKDKKYNNTASANNTNEENVIKDDDYYISGSKTVASDLDFWDDYDEAKTPETSPVPVDEILEQKEEDPSKDGLHTLIVHEDGTEEWIEINKGLPKNEYNQSNYSYKKPFMQYSENNRVISYEGVDISKVDDYVDFYALKDAGVDFVMIKLGQRGYSSGEISLDDNFTDNIKRANEAGLNVGVYFFSQATTTEEAVEEANFVIKSISDNKVSYPVAYYVEPVTGVETRNEGISQMQRTNYAKAFLETIKAAGYYPMIYGTKEYLIQKYSLGSLINDGFDYWLSEPSDIPDYPYKFSMWRYASDGKISGVSGYANLNISFIDYSVR